MDIITSLIIVAAAGLAHASFQLSISMLTLLSGHTISKKRSFGRLITLTNSFTLGVGIMTLLLLCFLALMMNYLDIHHYKVMAWTIGCGLLMGVGVAVAFLYYRKEQGTALWVPRGLARFLADRSKATKHSAEAFALGLSGAIGELLFTIAPLFIAALALTQLEPKWQLIGIGIYLLTSLLSLLIVDGMIGSGHSLSKIQKWREKNKKFLQITAGALLFILGLYVYVEHVILENVMAAARMI